MAAGKVGPGDEKCAIPALAQPASEPIQAERRAERGKHMAVDGNWNITLSTPLGDREATLALTSNGGVLTGKQAADGNEADIVDGTVNGNDVAWKASITNPMPLTLAFSGKVDGDSISGDVSIGPMGSFPFKGKRA